MYALECENIQMKFFNKIRISYKKLTSKLKFWWRKIEIRLSKRGIRINIYPLLSMGRHRYLIDPATIPNDQQKVNYIFSLFDEGIKKTESKYKVISVDNTNVDSYLSLIAEIEQRTYLKEHSLDIKSLRLRFTGKFFNQPICYLYFHNDKPVAYSLGNDLEFYNPFEYGFEVGCHSEYLKFSTFYAENISILPQYQNTMLMVRMVADLFYEIKKRGYSNVLAHTYIGNNTHKLLKKFGFVVLLKRESFLGINFPVCFMQMPNLENFKLKDE